MFVVSNNTIVEKQVSRNRLYFWFGVGCLAASMASLLFGAGEPYLVFLFGYPLLILGVVLSKRGSFANRRHGIGGYQIKSEENQIEEELKGVPPRYHLYNWIELGGKVFEHLLVTPNGIMIIKVKGQIGKVKANNDRWRLNQGIIGWIGSLGEPRLGNPSRELTEEVKNLHNWFETKGFEIPVDGIVVFNSVRAQLLEAEEMSFPVCQIKDLRQAIRSWETELQMGVQEQQEVEKLLITSLPASQATQVEQLLVMPEYKRKTLQETQKREKEKPELVVPKAKKVEKPPVPGTPEAMAQRTGLNGKPLPPKPLKVRKARRGVEPLPKINPGAFGETTTRKK